MIDEQQDTFSKDKEPGTNVCSYDVPINENDSLAKRKTIDSTINVNSESAGVNGYGDASCKKNDIPCVYRQDVVRKNRNGMIGIVTEVAGDADSDSSGDEEGGDDDDDDDDNDDDDEEEEGEGEEEEEKEEGRSDNGEGNKDGNNASRKNDGDVEGGNNKSCPLLADQVHVLWMDETESTENLSDITVVDRGFLHGDYVAAASDPTGEVGVVVDVNITVDLLSPNGSIVRDVLSKDLKRIREFTVGDYVVLGPWLGRVDDVLDNVRVLFDDGSVCKVTKADPLHLKPTSKNILEDGHFPYYPGQRVRASSSSVFRHSKWICGSWKANKLEGTVSKVTVGSVFIYWIASAGYGPDSSTAPAEEQSPKNLKLLSCFAHAHWQLGDWCLLPTLALPSSHSLDKGTSNLEIHDSTNNDLDSNQTGSGCDSEGVSVEEANGTRDSVDLDLVNVPKGNDKNVETSTSHESSSGSSLSVSKDHPVHEARPPYRKRLRKPSLRRDKKARKKEESFERALLIVNTRTKVDVAWQDGTRKSGLDSTSLIPIDNPGDHEFVAEQYVVEKTSDGDDTCEPRRVGVVRSVNAKERTACVRWLKPVSRAEDPREYEKEEIVSVYELEGHPDYDYCYGDVVVRLSPVLISPQETSIPDSNEKANKPNGHNETKQCVEKLSECERVDDVPGNETCLGFSALSWVGNITGLKDGDIEVTWADGMVSMVGPQAIYVVDRDDDDSVAGVSEVSDAASWETVNDNEMDTIEEPKEEIEVENSSSMALEAEENGEENSGGNAALSVTLAVLRFVTRLATGIFSRGQKSSHQFYSHSRGESETQSEGTLEILEARVTGDGGNSQSNVTFISDMENNDRKLEKSGASEPSEVFEATGALCSLRIEDSNAYFKRFDIVKDPSDHHFLGTNGQNNNGRRWFKKVQQDWTILQNNLPEGIFVRVYEDRIDLLRAVIVGAYGTPYQDGLFFFDFHLPPEYPDVPPSAHYHSGGWRINPNLYEEGKVCLSLLNTWTGKGNEVWDSTSSSILQVLVSLQGLVLNSKPYFNEAGYDKQIGTAEGEKNSLSYNENTFLLNCKTMMYLMRKLPKDFEVLVKEHFRLRGHYILKACDAYMKGFLIGSLTEDASVSDKSNQNATSVGFKLMLSKIVPKLFLALSEVGADCNEFKHLRQS